MKTKCNLKSVKDTINMHYKFLGVLAHSDEILTFFGCDSLELSASQKDRA